MPTKVKLSDIRSLTLYAGEETEARRSTPVPQLACIGKPCSKFQPDVVRCTNTGGSGVEVDWKCEADLPNSLRMGRVEVSCEGWSRPGDPYVLKGSCGLEYHLLEIPKAYRDGQGSSKSQDVPVGTSLNNAIDYAFYAFFAAVALFIGYHMIKACLSAPLRPNNTDRPRGGGGGGWFAGGGPTGPGPNYGAPPPPYTKDQPSTNNAPGAGWRPGFWTGLGLGGLAGRYMQPTGRERERAYDWERPQATTSWFGGPSRARPAAEAQPSPRANNLFAPSTDDRGEGSSTGATRRSTGYGGSRVR